MPCKPEIIYWKLRKEKKPKDPTYRIQHRHKLGIRIPKRKVIDRIYVRFLIYITEVRLPTSWSWLLKRCFVVMNLMSCGIRKQSQYFLLLIKCELRNFTAIEKSTTSQVGSHPMATAFGYWRRFIICFWNVCTLLDDDIQNTHSDIVVMRGGINSEVSCDYTLLDRFDIGDGSNNSEKFIDFYNSHHTVRA